MNAPNNNPSMRHPLRFLVAALGFAVCWGAITPNLSAQEGKATFYTIQSCLAEGNTGITASGEPFIESDFTIALRSRDFGKFYKLTNLETNKSIIARHNDFGPGKGPTKRGVIVDLSPAAYDALGGTRGINRKGISWGEIKKIKVEAAKQT